MEYKTLSNGVEMPKLGYGVFQIDDATTERCVEDAIASGYRMIDTAQAYGNERGVGAGIKASGVARDDPFIVSKVWVSDYGEGKTYDSIRRSLELLGTGHLDLMLLHQAYNDYHVAWRDMERAYADGLVRAIGVSNFDPTRLLDICTFAKVGKTVMLAYGGGSIKRNGVYDDVMGLLAKAGKDVVEFAGIMPNPTYAKVQEGARLAREKGVDFILAVGGGSVIDCVKIVSVQVKTDRDVWKMEFSDHEFPTEGIPMGAVVTIFGTGAEALEASPDRRGGPRVMVSWHGGSSWHGGTPYLSS